MRPTYTQMMINTYVFAEYVTHFPPNMRPFTYTKDYKYVRFRRICDPYTYTNDDTYVLDEKHGFCELPPVTVSNCI